MFFVVLFYIFIPITEFISFVIDLRRPLSYLFALFSMCHPSSYAVCYCTLEAPYNCGFEKGYSNELYYYYCCVSPGLHPCFCPPRQENGRPVEILPSLDDQIPVDSADCYRW